MVCVCEHIFFDLKQSGVLMAVNCSGLDYSVWSSRWSKGIAWLFKCICICIVTTSAEVLLVWNVIIFAEWMAWQCSMLVLLLKSASLGIMNTVLLSVLNWMRKRKTTLVNLHRELPPFLYKWWVSIFRNCYTRDCYNI